MDPAAFLRPGRYIDSDAPAVAAFARAAVGDATDPAEQARRLYYAVRDGIAYDPYVNYLDDRVFRASACLDAGRAYCVGKASVMTAAARAVGIPAALGLADVRNHLSSPRLRALVGGDEFIFHGYTELFLDGRWVKVTPTFNLALCERFGVRPLDFDGRSDALFHPFDAQGRRHMEYVRYHGTFADVPADRVQPAMRARYPKLMDFVAGRADADFAGEAGPA